MANSDKFRQSEQTKPVPKGQHTENEDKLASLKSFRSSDAVMVSVFKCGEKLSPAHKCPPHISLHVLEEILDALDIVQSTKDVDSEDDTT